MVAPEFPDFSAAERARNDLWVHQFSAALVNARSRTVRLSIGGSEPMDWCLTEVNGEWFRAETLQGATVIAQLSCVEWVEVEAGLPGPLPDPVAPKFRGVLGELARRRTLVRLVTRGLELHGRIHHVGADYIEFTKESGQPIVLPVSQLAWVELRGDD